MGKAIAFVVPSIDGTVGPGDPSIASVSVLDVNGSADGKPKKQITINYAAPGTLGTFTGVHVYLDHPDSSGGLSIADGTIPADGTISAGGTFQPESIGSFPYDATNPLIVFEVAAPEKNENWRVYLVPIANTFEGKIIQFGQPGASVSAQFLVLGPQPAGSGREYAPNVEAATLVSATVSIADSGDQYFVVVATWTWPTADQNYSSLGGVNLVLDDGVSQVYLGNVSGGAQPLYASPHFTVRPGTKHYRLWLLSYSSDAKSNSIIPGVTPSVTFDIVRNTGAAGLEYAALALADPLHAFVTAVPVSGADGTSLLRVTGYFTAPADPAFAGADIVALKPDGNYYTIKSGRLSPIENDISQPAAVESWTFYLRSIDINGLRNSIVGGVTPSVALSVGNATGLLNIGKALSSSFSNEFQIVGGVFKVLNLSAATVTTGLLQVGGGGSKVSQMKIFDTLNSLIGFIGDDTSGTGYVGAWFKQARIGGTLPSNAPLQADTGGNVTLNGATFTLNSGGSTTTLNNTVDATVGVRGVVCKNNTAPSKDVAVSDRGFSIRATDQFTYVAQLIAAGDAGELTLSNLANGNNITLNTGGGGQPFIQVSGFGFSARLSASGAASLLMNSVQVVTSRQTGWSAATGGTTRGGFATTTVTLPLLAENVRALIDALMTHGLIGT